MKYRELEKWFEKYHYKSAGIFDSASEANKFAHKFEKTNPATMTKVTRTGKEWIVWYHQYGMMRT